MKEVPFTIHLNIFLFPYGNFELLFHFIYYCVFVLGVSPIKESGFSNHADSRLIVESYVWGRGKIHYQESSQTVINTDVNTRKIA